MLIKSERQSARWTDRRTGRDRELRSTPDLQKHLRNVESEHDRTEPYMTKHNRTWSNKAEHDRYMTEQNVTLVCAAYRCVARQPATLYTQSFCLYRCFVHSLAASLFTIIVFQKYEFIVEGFLLNFGRFRVQFAIRILLLSVAPQRFLNFAKVS